MHDFKYRALIMGGASVRKALDVKTHSLRAVCEAFVDNIFRIASFALTPAEISFRFRRDQRWYDYAIWKATGKLSPDLPQIADEVTQEIVDREVQELAKAFYMLPQQKIDELRLELGINHINRFLDISHGMYETMAAIMSAVIIESWTSFETLAGDLWAVGVDNAPTQVINQIFGSAELQKPDAAVVKTAHQRGLDARNKPGTFLKETRQVSFQKLDNIKRYYSLAFQTSNELFDDTVGGYIVGLFAYRNALVHRSGRADYNFKEQVQRFAELRDIQEGTQLLLDGELVRRLRDAAIHVGIALIQCVDGVLADA